MVRLAGIIACLTGVLACMAVMPPTLAAGPGNLGPDDAARCGDVASGKPIHFDGRTLLETPDMPPELRLVNALISMNCPKRAEQSQEAFAAAHPQDYRVAFLNARLAWMVDNKQRAKAIGDEVLRQHPDFSSMLVLMASLAVDEKDYERAQTMLGRVDSLEPDDLWAYIDRLRLQADLTPSPAVFERMRALIMDSQFSAGARQTVYNDAIFMQGVTDPQRDELFAAMMGKPDTAKDCVLAEKAVEVIEIQGDAAGGARLIEENLRTSGECAATPMVRLLLAEAYLLQAAKISPRPNERNARLVTAAQQAMSGDLTELARRAARSPGLLDPIAPFFKGGVERRSDDPDAQSLVCVALGALNPVMVKEELDNGANPNGRCEHSSLVGRLLLTATVQHVPQRQAILRTLLERGARLEGLDSCANHDNGDCAQVLLPILQEFDQRRASSRTKL